MPRAFAVKKLSDIRRFLIGRSRLGAKPVERAQACLLAARVLDGLRDDGRETPPLRLCTPLSPLDIVGWHRDANFSGGTFHSYQGEEMGGAHASTPPPAMAIEGGPEARSYTPRIP